MASGMGFAARGAGAHEARGNDKKHSSHAGTLNGFARGSRPPQNAAGMGAPHKSLRGQFLLDGGRLQGGYFRRTVVLVCDHKPEGAFGLVLNRPSEAVLKDVFDRDLPESLRGEVLHSGGPVEPAGLSYLWEDAGNLDSFLPGLSVGHDLERLVEIAEKAETRARLRVFAGYAGWSPGQLDDEMKRDAWITHPANLDLVFHAPAAGLWRQILLRRGGHLDRLLADSPEDPAWN
jgi:putative transcriptional regulator